MRAPQVPDDVQVLPHDYVWPLDLEETFGGCGGSLHVDAGCGDGGFLLEMAHRYPQQRFLGIERLLGRVRKICRAACRERLANVRVLRIETSYAIRYLLPPGSVSFLYVFFPDPWPKERHHERRLITPDFLDAAHRALAGGGELRIKTDHAGYAEAIAEALGQVAGWQALPWAEVADGTPILTDFERQFLNEGRTVHRYLMKKQPILA